MRRSESREERSGWAKAPPIVEAEIRAVWQEDELPDEITQAPGFRPFTLGLDSQEWVDSMAEVVDGGNGVYGRPKPVAAPVHRQLATPPPPAPAPRVDSRPNLPAPRYSPPPSPRPRILMPEIDDTPTPVKPHPVMPEIDGATPAKLRTVMPEVDAASSSPRPHVLMPEIDDAAPPPVRTLPKRVVMPDIGGEEKPRGQPPPSMPEIG